MTALLKPESSEEETVSLNEILSCLCCISHWLITREQRELSQKVDNLYADIIDRVRFSR